MLASIEIRSAVLTYAVITRPNGSVERITGRPGTVLVKLLDKREITWDQIIQAIYPDANDEPDDARGVAKEVMSRVRKKLHGTGWRLESVHGEGYMLLGPEA